jgi:hypothetical protein
LGADHQIDNNGLNSAGHCLVANQHRQHYQVTSTEPGQVSQLACKDVTDSTSALQAELDFQFETFPVTSDSISPARLALNLRDHDISNSLLDSHQHPASSAGATTVTCKALSHLSSFPASRKSLSWPACSVLCIRHMSLEAIWARRLPCTCSSGAQYFQRVHILFLSHLQRFSWRRPFGLTPKMAG